MTTSNLVRIAAGGLLTIFAAAMQDSPGRAQSAGVPVDSKSISGVVVNNQNGQTPEAGVWVIAETDSLPTHFRRIVVTDDRGRFRDERVRRRPGSPVLRRQPRQW